MHPGLTGGKGSALARLLQAGFAVPEGFVVTTTALTGFLAGLPDRLPATMSSAAFPQPLARAIGRRLTQLDAPGDCLWAVRSSAVAEDLKEASFAGQYETVLGVQGLPAILAAIKSCWTSFFAQRAREYQQKQGLAEFGGAVVVQKLLDARAAGVGFSVNPFSGDAKELVINANYGLGETVVGGLVTPDSFVIHKSSGKIVQRSKGAKQLVWRWDRRSATIRKKPCSHTQQQSWCLSPADLTALRTLALQLERQEGQAVDFEWAFEGRQLYLLQSRAITTHASSTKESTAPVTPPPDWAPELNSHMYPGFPLYSNGNISEVLPGCITPLSWSYIGPTLEHAFRQPPIELGVSPQLPQGPLVMGYFYGRPYLNISYFMEVARRTPGATPDTVYEEFVGPLDGPPTPPLSMGDLRPGNLVKLLRVLNMARVKRSQLLGQVAAMEDFYRREAQKLADSDLQKQDLISLVEQTSLTRDRLWPAEVHIWVSQFAVITFDFLRRLSQAWLDDTQGVLAASLVSGIGSLPSADPALHIYALSRQVLASRELRHLFATHADHNILYDRIGEDTRDTVGDFALALQKFLREFGHRAICEAELRSPNWREEPGQVLAMVRNYLSDSAESPSVTRARQEQHRQEVYQSALQKLNPAKRKLFGYILADARRFIAARETMKNNLILLSGLARQLNQVIRNRMVAEGLLDQADDIFFLVKEELLLVATGKLTADEISSIVRRRRQEFAWCQSLRVPRLMDGEARILSDEDVPITGDMLSGIACSPGVVEGVARVVLDPRRDSYLAQGEILVAPVTDAGWTPLFVPAAALVVDVGGLLSHGSIVAREYGLPAVVNVTDATKRIKTGDRIRVDGGKGLVWLLDSEEG